MDITYLAVRAVTAGDELEKYLVGTLHEEGIDRVVAASQSAHRHLSLTWCLG